MQQAETSYGFIYVSEYDEQHCIDLYLPRAFLRQLQLLPGSQVLAQGMKSPNAEILLIKPSKGADHPNMGQHAFIASIRFPNRPETLLRFLSEAHRRGIKFASIRTHGTRGLDLADVICEGGLPQRQQTFEEGIAIGLELGAAARVVDGRTNYAYALQYGKASSGEISTSIYEITLPIIRGRYGRARFTTDRKNKILRSLEGKPQLVRLALDRSRMLVSVDLTISSRPAYLFEFRAAELSPAAPVTQTILELLAAVNIDALNALEYPEFDPAGYRRAAGGRAITRVGAIEMLFTTNEPLEDVSKAEGQLREAIDAKGWAEEFSLTILPLREESETWASDAIPDDAGWSLPAKALNFGRYLYLGHLGDGASSIVNSYLDRKDGQVVAGKHLIKSKGIKEAELRALIRATMGGGSPHIIRILDHFFDGDIPVLILEAVDGTLAGNAWDTASQTSEPRHRVPWNMSEFLRMAGQVLRGLEWLHSKGVQDERLLHGDLKPANIGFKREGNSVIWKLLDFGLTKVLAGMADMETTVHIGGTAPYMSPQVLLGEKRVENDIFALGVVFFRLLNDWRFPGVRSKGPLNRGVLEEVVSFLGYVEGAGKEMPSFAKEGWKLGLPFSRESLEPDLEVELREVVFGMLKFKPEQRPGDAGELAALFELWAGKVDAAGGGGAAATSAADATEAFGPEGSAP